MFSFFIQAFVSIFAILNPVSNIPLTLGLTGEQGSKEGRQIALKAVVIALGILTTFLLLGQFVFSMFHITINGLRLAGGMIIFAIGYHLIQTKKMTNQALCKNEQNDRSIIAGTGTLAAAMSLTSSQNYRWMHVGVTFIAFCFVFGITIFLLLMANWVQGRIGHGSLAILTRITGLVLTVIAVEMVFTGLTDMLPILERRTASV